MKKITLITFLLSCVGIVPARQLAKREITARDHFQLWNTCKPINLFIEDLSSDAMKIGLKENAIEKMIRSRLRAARLYDKESSAHFYVKLSVVGQAFNIVVEINKKVHDSASDLFLFAPTWQRSTTGTHEGNKSHIMSNISQGIDRFLDEYLRVNESACK